MNNYKVKAGQCVLHNGREEVYVSEVMDQGTNVQGV